MKALSKAFTPKQEQIIKELFLEDWFIAVLHGAKRTGKTYLNNLLFLNELKRVRQQADKEGVRKPMYILAGYSMSNIQDNILNELYNSFGIEVKPDKFGSFELMGVKIVQTTHGDLRGIGRIRGMTAYGAYINEASLSKEEVFDEIKTRLSGNGARLICDTNPDQPEHWLKRDYIDQADGKLIREYHFELDDNTFLNERYKQAMMNSVEGVFYDRNIKGLWVSGKGVVYSSYDKRKHMLDISFNQNDYTEFICGIDWGYEHYGSFVVFGYHTERQAWILVHEVTKKHLDIDEWVNIVESGYDYCGLNKYQTPFYADSARPEHVDRMIDEGFNCINAHKSILSGVEYIGGLIKRNQLYVLESAVDRFNKDIYMYVWEEKTGKPVKQHDDSMDAMRYALYSHHMEELHLNDDDLTIGVMNALF